MIFLFLCPAVEAARIAAMSLICSLTAAYSRCICCITGSTCKATRRQCFTLALHGFRCLGFTCGNVTWGVGRVSLTSTGGIPRVFNRLVLNDRRLHVRSRVRWLRYMGLRNCRSCWCFILFLAESSCLSRWRPGGGGLSIM